MRSWIRKHVPLAMAAALLAPLAASAADVRVGGKGPRVRTLDGRSISAAGRPVLIASDALCGFGQPNVPGAPPLVIQIEGDVTIVPQEDGSLRIVLEGKE